MPRSGLSAYFVLNRSTAPAAGAEALGAADPPAAVDGAAALGAGAVLGAGVAAPWHAANTNIVLASGAS